MKIQSQETFTLAEAAKKTKLNKREIIQYAANGSFALSIRVSDNNLVYMQSILQIGNEAVDYKLYSDFVDRYPDDISALPCFLARSDILNLSHMDCLALLKHGVIHQSIFSSGSIINDNLADIDFNDFKFVADRLRMSILSSFPYVFVIADQVLRRPKSKNDFVSSRINKMISIDDVVINSSEFRKLSALGRTSLYSSSDREKPINRVIRKALEELKLDVPCKDLIVFAKIKEYHGMLIENVKIEVFGEDRINWVYNDGDKKRSDYLTASRLRSVLHREKKK